MDALLLNRWNSYLPGDSKLIIFALLGPLIEIGIIALVCFWVWRRFRPSTTRSIKVIATIGAAALCLTAFFWRPIYAKFLIDREDTSLIVSENKNYCDNVSVADGLDTHRTLESKGAPGWWQPDRAYLFDQKIAAPKRVLTVTTPDEGNTGCFPWVLSKLATSCVVAGKGNPYLGVPFAPSQELNDLNWQRIVLSGDRRCQSLIRERALRTHPHMRYPMFTRRLGSVLPGNQIERPVECVRYEPISLVEPTLALAEVRDYREMFGGVWRFRGETQLIELTTGEVLVRSKAAVILKAGAPLNWELGQNQSRGHTLDGISLLSHYREKNCGEVSTMTPYSK